VLWEALAAASGLHSRRRSHLPVPDRVHRIPDYIDDFSCLNVLPAFQALQRDIRELAGSLV
jgi:hypothetical protein